jgi:O-antigen/teichoic acid export membrane protein
LTQPAAQSNNTLTVARNSVWYGIELLFGLFGAFLTSILVARVIGPQRLGYFQYLVWLTTITTSVGCFGLPATTRKYMAECLNRGDAPAARAIYHAALRLQVLIAGGVTLAGVGLVLVAVEPSQRLIAVLLVMNVAPRMIGFMPSEANNAAEMMKRSTPPALIGGALNIVLTLLSLWLGWDLVGVAASVVAGAAVETALKLHDVRRRLAPIPMGKVTPELRKRIFSYSGQALVLMLLNVVVWDRSDLVILKILNPDIKQVTFFSIAFNLTERALMFPRTFGISLGVTMMAQYGRGPEALNRLVVSGAKYALLLALPLLLGMACLSGPTALLLYGHRYAPLIPVLSIAAVLAIPKALSAPPTTLLQTTENQGFLIWVGCCCGALDLLLDVLLTPHYGATGAAWANGVAQTVATACIWVRVRNLFRLRLPFGEFGRIAASGAAMAAAALVVAHLLPGYSGMFLAIVAGAFVWCACLRLTRAVAAEDRDRLLLIGTRLPGRGRPFFNRFVVWIAGEENRAAAPRTAAS